MPFNGILFWVEACFSLKGNVISRKPYNIKETWERSRGEQNKFQAVQKQAVKITKILLELHYKGSGSCTWFALRPWIKNYGCLICSFLKQQKDVCYLVAADYYGYIC
jgi:hypothetical protein